MKIIKTILLVLVLFCLTIVIINTSPFDEKLNPQVVEILKDAPFPPVEGNAYFASLGLLEIYGRDINQTGEQIIKYMIENKKENRNELTKEQRLEFFELNTDLDLFWQVPVLSCEMQNNNGCLSKNYGDFYDSSFKSGINQPRLQLLLQRFDKILTMDTYQVYLDSGTFVDILPYSNLRKLGEIQLINKYKNYSHEEFLKQLYIDITFWKMVLTQSDFLLEKIMAVSQIRKDVLFLSEFLRLNEVDSNNLTLMKNILKPLSAKDKDLSDAFETEARYMFNMSYEMEKSSSFFDNLFFQPNATNNYYYEISLKPIKQLSKKPLKQFILIRQIDKRKTPEFKFKFHYFYNFIGKMLSEYGKPNAGDYISRMHDTDNMIRLIDIQLQIKLSKNKDIYSILSKPQNLNPYTDKPYEYNQKENTIGFDCIDDFMDCQVRM